MHLFYNCNKIKDIWIKLRAHFLSRINIPLLSPQSAILGFFDDDHNENFLIINHLLLIFKFYIYKERENENLSLPILMKRISKIKSIEETNCGNDTSKLTKFNKKWKKIKNMLYSYKQEESQGL